MKTDASGAAAANDNDNLEGRLSDRFAVELDRAERDYPALRAERLATNEPLRRERGAWPRLALSVTTVGVLAVLAVIGVGLAWRPATVPAVAPIPSGVAMGSDGIPATIDGQHVYRVTDQQEWQDLSGSFLLGGFANHNVADCPALPSQPPAEASLLLDVCGWFELRSSIYPGMAGSTGLAVAPHNSALLTGSVGGPAVVVRVHTHDPEAARCGTETRAACEAAIVVEAVVWPYIPTEIGGEHVYRASDRNSFADLGATFLLGGVVTEPDLIPACPAPIDKSDAEGQLIPYCTWVSIDAQPLAPKGLAMGDLLNRPVVVRVHVNDPLAAQCPAEVRPDCQAAIVVEAVVWQGESLVPGPSESVGPTPTPRTAGSPNPAASETAGPAATDQFGPDGVPTILGGQPVYRAGNLPTAQTFLLGGKLTRDTGCAAPATPLAKPPACGYWMLDGVVVGTAVDLPEAIVGQPVVGRVQRGRVLVTCAGGSCTKDTIVIFEIVWSQLPVAPPPLLPSAPPA
jgi:hypothetical protein